MIKPPTRAEFKKVQQQVKDALKLASTHDPDLVKSLQQHRKYIDTLWKWNVNIDDRLAIAERQLGRLGAPQYRNVK